MADVLLIATANLQQILKTRMNQPGNKAQQRLIRKQEVQEVQSINPYQ
jgi:hypothetical protein